MYCGSNWLMRCIVLTSKGNMIPAQCLPLLLIEMRIEISVNVTGAGEIRISCECYQIWYFNLGLGFIQDEPN